MIFLEIIQGRIWKESEGRRMYAKMFPNFVQSELLLESLVRLVDVWGGAGGCSSVSFCGLLVLS